MGETPVDEPVFDKPTAGVIRKLVDELSLLLDDLKDSAPE
ncbi:MAG: hypothetical protein ACI81O_002615 [Cyclobacteriaceae bacterium]|jgi:hypothetical protein